MKNLRTSFLPSFAVCKPIALTAALVMMLGCNHLASESLNLKESMARDAENYTLLLSACLSGVQSSSDIANVTFTASEGELYSSTQSIQENNRRSVSALINDRECAEVFFKPEYGSKRYLILVQANGIKSLINITMINPDQIILSLLPAKDTIGENGEKIDINAFTITPESRTLIALPKTYTTLEYSEFENSEITTTDDLDSAHQLLNHSQYIDVCFYPDNQDRCSSVDFGKALATEEDLNNKHPRISEILPLSVAYCLGQTYYVNIIGDGFEKDSLAWVSNTPAQVLLSTPHRLLISFPTPRNPVSISAGGETIYVLNPKSGVVIKKKGFNFSGTTGCCSQ